MSMTVSFSFLPQRRRHAFAGLPVFLALALAGCGGGSGGSGNSEAPPSVQAASNTAVLLTNVNASGEAGTVSLSGPIDTSNPFFKPFGNGRSCATCQQQDDGWTLTPAGEPYGYANANELALFRRPPPAANLSFVTAVMWDGRETYADPNSGICIIGTGNCYAAPEINFANQALHAVTGHAQFSAGLTASEQAAIVLFEKGLFSAQLSDKAAGSLNGAGAGGPAALASAPFYFGINDFDAGDYRTRAAFTPKASTLFDAWNTSANLADPNTAPADAPAQTAARQAIARGQTLFNNAPIFLNNVPGLKNASVRGTCTTCHDAPNIGAHSTPLLFNLGLSDADRRTSDLPLYTLRNKATGAVIQTTDPGAAMATGKWDDIGRFKVPVLRGLAARAPYLHNGSAKDLTAVVNFYNERFKIGFNAQEIADLVAYLKAL